MTRNKLLIPTLSGILAIVMTIGVTVGWNIIFTKYYALSTQAGGVSDYGAGFWFLLSLGDVFLVLIIAVLVVFLVSNVRQVRYVRRQDTFIDSVTHELKSPLASLRLCLETMATRELTPDMGDKLVAMMQGDVDRLQAFIEHVLEAGRLEHKERELTYEPTVLPEIAERCLKQIQQRHQLRGDRFELVLELAASERPIVTDAMALEIILLNLLDNAVKYSGSTVKIRLTLSEGAGKLFIEVKDSGIGIPANKLKTIFTRFYRIQRSGPSRVTGTGLGLYVVASLVKRLGGKISASSEGESRGSTFHVELPSRQAELAPSVVA